MAGQIEIEHHSKCLECGAPLELEVCQSAAGFYLGTHCDRCGPHGRESEYIINREEAEKILARWNAGDKVGARTTAFNPVPVYVVTGDEAFAALENAIRSCQGDSP